MMRRVIGLVLLLGIGACGDRSIVGPESHGRIPCRPSPELVAMVVTPPFAPIAMQSALVHGSSVMTLAITDAQRTRDVTDAMRLASQEIGTREYDSACRYVEIAYDALREIPDAPASRPDRVGIMLILSLTAQSLTTVIPR